MLFTGKKKTGSERQGHGSRMKEYTSLVDAIKDICGDGIGITSRSRALGGDINDAYVLFLSDGSKLFIKQNRRDNVDFFRAEALGLSSIEKTDTIKVPKIKAIGTEGSEAFLVMECIDVKGAAKGWSERFGANLAKLHSAPAEEFTSGGRFGFLKDNYIGAGYQENGVCDTWIEFFRSKRLLPQIKRAEKYFDKNDLASFDKLLEKLDFLLVEPDSPSLLHGDLWSGNYMIGNDGEAWLIDPATYVGHAEADLAMTELFGGFDRHFYEGYKAVRPLQDGYEDRRDLYNLYHILNHLNLFGIMYLSGVKRTLNYYV